MPDAPSRRDPNGGGGGDRCRAIFKVSSSGMVGSGFPLCPPPHPPSSEGSVFPPVELYLGLSEAKSNSFPSLPHPHRKPGGHRPGNTFKSLLSASRMPPLGDKVCVRRNQSRGVGWHGPSLLRQPNHASLADGLHADQEGCDGPPPLLRTPVFSQHSRRTS